MKASEQLFSALKGMGDFANSMAKAKELLPSLMNEAMANVEEKDKEKFTQFVKESNELINKSINLDINTVRNLTNDLRVKYGISSNHR